MKKLKLIFGLLIVAAFIGSALLSYSHSSDEQAVRKDRVTYIPTRR